MGFGIKIVVKENKVGIWEQIHNVDFNLVEFDQIKTEYGKNSFAMSPTQWIKRTNALLIENNVSQSERLIRLNNSARRQMKTLQNNKNLYELEKLQDQVNNEKNILD